MSSTLSPDNKPILIAALLIGAYFYLNKRPTTAVAGNTGFTGVGYKPGVIPGSAGTGLNQVQSGALIGFLQAVSKGVLNNGSTPLPQQRQPVFNFPAVQDEVSDTDGNSDPYLWSVGGDSGDYTEYA